MQVQNIECQIAQAQIGSFLAGSGLSDEAMRQLEEHIAGCGDCKQALNAKRVELKAMLTPERATVDFQAIHQEAEEMQAKSIASALRKRSLQKLSDPEPERQIPKESKPLQIPAAATAVVETDVPKNRKSNSASSYWKPLLYSLGLAGVLIGMSLFSNNLAAIFGPKADVKASDPAPTSEVTTARTVEESAVPPVQQPAENAIAPKVQDQPAATIAQKTVVPPTGIEKSEPVAQPVEQISNVGATIGANAASLASTQFESVVQTEQPKVPVQKPTAPALKPAVSRNSVSRMRANKRRINRNRQVIRRPAATKPARSRGIKVYQP